jgi:hypothetical protein
LRSNLRSHIMFSVQAVAAAFGSIAYDGTSPAGTPACNISRVMHIQEENLSHDNKTTADKPSHSICRHHGASTNVLGSSNGSQTFSLPRVVLPRLRLCIRRAFVATACFREQRDVMMKHFAHHLCAVAFPRLDNQTRPGPYSIG